MRFTLKQLQVFLATARVEKISEAADRLNMSQSAASGALKELEQHLDTLLFDRAGKRLIINDAGRALQPKAEDLLARADSIDAEFTQNRYQSPLRVGATVTIGNYLLMPLLAQFHAEKPDAQVLVDVANTRDITARLLRFELDVALIEGEINHSDLVISPWRTDELAVFCAPNHPLARKKRLSDKDLVKTDWIVREPGSGTRQSFDRAMHDLLPAMKIRYILSQSEAIKQAALCGLGIGCLSKTAIKAELERGDLLELALPHRDFSRQLYIVLHKNKHLSHSIQSWLNICAQTDI